MSLFTVLKHGNTNLGSDIDLSTVPEEILNKYYSAVFPSVNTIYTRDWIMTRAVRLANLYNLHLTVFDPEIQVQMKQLFKKILTDYEETV